MPHSLFVFLVDVFRLGVWLAVLVAIFVPLEKLFGVAPKQIFRKAFLTDLGYYFLSGLLPKLVLVFPLAAVAWFVHAAVPAPIHNWAQALPFWERLAASFVVGEIGFYWGHRWSHEIPFLWRFHAIHHSAEEMDWLVNTKAHPVDLIFTRLCGFVPMYVLGLAQPSTKTLDVVPLLVILAGTIWGFFIHSNVSWRLEKLTWFISTPAFHHWHHTYKKPFLINYASMLPVLDRIFGSYHVPAKEWPAQYGTSHPVADGLMEQLIQPLLPGGRKAREETTPSMDPDREPLGAGLGR